MFTTLGMYSAHRGPPVLLRAIESERNTEPVVTLDIPQYSAGNLVVVFTSGAANISTYGPPAGTTQITSPSPTLIRAFYFVAPGTSVGTTTMDISYATGNPDDHSVNIALVYDNVDVGAEGKFACTSQVSDGTPNPPSVTGSGTGWVAGSNQLVTAMTFGAEVFDVTNYPTNCPLYRQFFNSGSLGLGSGVACAVTTALTFDPDAFTISSPQTSNVVSFILKGFP